VDIGKKIKYLRESKNISQTELAKLSKLSQAFISSIENDHKRISLNALEKICTALNIDVVDFFVGDKKSLYLNDDIKENNSELFNLIKELEKSSPSEIRKLKEFLKEINKDREKRY